jgi:hypothetical protein
MDTNRPHTTHTKRPKSYAGIPTQHTTTNNNENWTTWTKTGQTWTTWTVKKMGRSAVEQSPCRRQIEEMILSGETDRYISDWTREHDCYISKSAINNYRQKFNPNKKARQKYHEKKSKERLDKATEKILSDLEFCDKVKDIASKVNVKVDEKTSPLDTIEAAV